MPAGRNSALHVESPLLHHRSPIDTLEATHDQRATANRHNVRLEQFAPARHRVRVNDTPKDEAIECACPARPRRERHEALGPIARRPCITEPDAIAAQSQQPRAHGSPRVRHAVAQPLDGSVFGFRQLPLRIAPQLLSHFAQLLARQARPLVMQPCSTTQHPVLRVHLSNHLYCDSIQYRNGKRLLQMPVLTPGRPTHGADKFLTLPIAAQGKHPTAKVTALLGQSGVDVAITD